MNNFNRVFGGVWPIAAIIIALWMTQRGCIDLGRGEKDIAWLIPILIYTLVYTVAYVICTKMKVSVIKSILISSVLGFVILVLVTVLFADLMGVKLE